MTFGELKVTRGKLMRIAGLLAVTTAVAGCSSDATRLQDSFYTGAIPQSAPQQPAYAQAPQQPAYGAYPAQQGGGATYTPQPSAGSPVSRSELPPPSAAPAAAQSAAPVQTASRAPSGGGITVESGDSLGGIARRAGVSVADLRAANGLSSDNIRIGQVLQLPAGANTGAANTRVASLGTPPTTLQEQAAHVTPSAAPATTPVQTAPVQASATPAQTPPASQPQQSQPAAVASTTVEEQTEQQTAALAPESTGISQFRWPVQGRVVKSFGDKVGSRRNDGLNISVPRGTPVKAAENGVVIYAGEGLKEFGKTVLVKHDNGLVTVYGHADEILVERGANVRRGQDIAKAGMTGDTDAPMLHFEVRKDSSPVNPMTYLQ
ncbi:peptidoglycan DD-metalloendopeptidase family protein [Aureimonas altamirensis]|jgi:murein DD-endopeptidase MepM/ murein hydrolase activator NlpD|uniref:Murein DD-endopeptidase MepM and murein hydrolase activator NlpD, contain LysM domain n=2 Tax=Aureimonas altamirensis TaxID=370622 RepID=A0ABY1IML7_9HYPH|nr:peptidoglycan DD-metalloendopeptidase family protein [Aureimonas altamirensis]BAT26440.1 putative peptidoglycan-binding peptidase, M23/M37 family [Aureimonas altamirensis]SHJ48064.1 Murein DD-endopeptidase MepM and murein hydrolase activator NlpD, contain LysM domain [Aureimonas altamirensis DSM 21988]